MIGLKNYMNKMKGGDQGSALQPMANAQGGGRGLLSNPQGFSRKPMQMNNQMGRLPQGFDMQNMQGVPRWGGGQGVNNLMGPMRQGMDLGQQSGQLMQGIRGSSGDGVRQQMQPPTQIQQERGDLYSRGIDPMTQNQPMPIGNQLQPPQEQINEWSALPQDQKDRYFQAGGAPSWAQSQGQQKPIGNLLQGQYNMQQQATAPQQPSAPPQMTQRQITRQNYLQRMGRA